MAREIHSEGTVMKGRDIKTVKRLRFLKKIIRKSTQQFPWNFIYTKGNLRVIRGELWGDIVSILQFSISTNNWGKELFFYY